MSNNYKENHSYLAQQTLGFSPCLGSKSGYQELYPEKEPIFNAIIMAQDAGGELYKIWYGDLELTDGITKEKLILLSGQLDSNLYLYRSSTVNNETFNGRMFPYKDFVVTVCKHRLKLIRNQS